MLVNPSIRAACLLIAGNLYGNREDVVVGTISSELPMGSRSMLMPYRVELGV
ncbi:phage gp6-like head-tail connector protein [Pseudomonas rhodesiae]|nr:phage gp6-like head-tail connector protein [Pseudomonas rhodesiae]